MADSAGLHSERFPKKVGAIFRRQTDAVDVRDHLLAAGFDEDQVRLVGPGDEERGRAIEPEGGGIARLLARSHLTFGLVGLLGGIAAAVIGMALDLPIFAGEAPYVFLLAGFFGAIGGLLLAGLVSLRPDHDALAMAAQEAVRHGAWTVVVHAADTQEQREAKHILQIREGEPIATL